MTPSRTRRLSTVIAGVVAMTASLTALGAIVVSDIAEAKATSDVAILDDALPVAPPVKMTKVLATPAVDDFDDLLEPFQQPQPKKLGKRSKKPIDFGSFEGY